MITPHAGGRRSNPVWGMFSFPVIISTLSAVQMVRYRNWLWLLLEMVALALLAGSISYLARITRKVGMGGEDTVWRGFLGRAVFLTCAAYVVLNLCIYIMLVINHPS